MTALSREALDQLKARQIAFFQRRLVTEEARDEWRANLTACYRELLRAPLGVLVDAGALAHAVDTALRDPLLESAVRPVSNAVAAFVVAELRADQNTVGHYVPAHARAKIDTALEHEDLVDDRFIRAVVEQDAVEEVMRDVLYDAIKEFNEKANPVFAEWGLLGLAKRFMPIGFGALSKSLEAVRGEFERRLEPEIRRFLQGFSRQALKKSADFAIAHKDDEKFVALRKNIAAFIYGERLADVTRSCEAELTALVHDAVHDIVAHVSALPEMQARRRQVVTAFVARHAGDSLETVLTRYGASPPSEVNAFADATWPLLKTALESEPVRAYIAGMVSASYEGS